MAEEYTEKELRAVVGKNADSYLAIWQPILSGEKSKNGFHIAAFFFPLIWSLYRRMYAVAGGVSFAFFVAKTIRKFIVGIAGTAPGYAVVPLIVSLVLGLVTSLVCALWSNSWYLSHVQGIVDSVRAQGLEGEPYYEALTQKGGRSWRPVLLVAGMFGLLVAIGYIWASLK